MRLLRLHEVKEVTGLSRSSIYADATFPKRVKLIPSGRAVGWVQAEIHDWVSARVASRDEA